MCFADWVEMVIGNRLFHGMEASFKAAKELHNEVSATNADFKKVYESLTSYSNNSYAWFQVAEVGYDNFVARHSQS